MIKALELNKKWNFDIDLVVTTGPNIFSALSTGELDIGYLGNGMAWHYFEPDSKIANITAAMQDQSADGCVTYGNPRQTLERGTDNYVMAASPSPTCPIPSPPAPGQ